MRSEDRIHPTFSVPVCVACGREYILSDVRPGGPNPDAARTTAACPLGHGGLVTIGIDMALSMHRKARVERDRRLDRDRARRTKVTQAKLYP